MIPRIAPFTLKKLIAAVALVVSIVANISGVEASQWPSWDGRECYSSGYVANPSVGQEPYRVAPRRAVQYRTNFSFNLYDLVWNEERGEEDFQVDVRIWLRCVLFT